MCRLNPKVDLAFKKLFGSEENKDILIAFINSMMLEEEQIQSITLKNPYNLSSYMDGKLSVLDIKAEDEKGRQYDIEIQIAPQNFYDKQALYYWAKVYADQLLSKGRYGTLNKTIGINILDFNYLEGNDYHSVYKLYNTKTQSPFSDLMELHFVELKKFDQPLQRVSNALERWIHFLNHAYEYSKEKIPKELEQDTYVKKAIEVLDLMYLNMEERELYEQTLKAFLDKQEEMDTAREEGEEIKAIEIAKNLLDVLDVEMISQKTGLTIEEILKLK